MLPNKLSATFYVASLFIMGCTSSATSSPSTATSLLQKIKAEGARSVIEELEGEQWNIVLNNIETGEPYWLEIGTELHAVTDAGLSEMLTLSAGIALVHAPKEVLLTVVPEMPIDGVCGYPDMTDEKTDTQEEVAAYLDARIDSVNNISEKAVSSRRNLCLKTLEDTKREVLSPQGPFSRE